ncbi:hypothetical protein SDC9_93185 [bioreactor metagenome]|uniref:Uncharacterized protein n=1 Tax=bioreactor metagenome TaxID=1076179 RepID=A0A645A0C8_9ZZZZ
MGFRINGMEKETNIAPVRIHLPAIKSLIHLPGNFLSKIQMTAHTAIKTMFLYIEFNGERCTFSPMHPQSTSPGIYKIMIIRYMLKMNRVSKVAIIVSFLYAPEISMTPRNISKPINNLEIKTLPSHEKIPVSAMLSSSISIG